MQREINPPAISRRNVLRAAGGVAGAVIFPATLGNATATASVPLNGEAFEGVAYDPVSHEILGDASAKLGRSETRIKGALELLGQKIDVDLVDPDVNVVGSGERKFRFREIERKVDGSTRVSALVVSYGNGVTGYVDATSGHRVAFSVASTAAGLSKEDAKKAVTGGN